MDKSMHGNLPVEVLFPDYQVSRANLSPNDWAALAFKLHGELNGFYSSGTTGSGVGSIPWLLENVDLSSYSRKFKFGQVKIVPIRIDDSRCLSTTKGAIFTCRIMFGEIPAAWEWQSVKTPRKSRPKSVTLPRARRTVHLIFSLQGFFIVIVRWVPTIKWHTNGRGEYELICRDTGFETESIKVTEASSQQLASFLKNYEKTSDIEGCGRELL